MEALNVRFWSNILDTAQKDYPYFYSSSFKGNLGSPKKIKLMISNRIVQSYIFDTSFHMCNY